MKKIMIFTVALGLSATAASAQACDTLRGQLLTQTLTADKSYVLDGVVTVPSGETLTIRPGVTICAMPDAALIIDVDGKIDAIGKTDSLITFTTVQSPGSRTSGYWRGITWLGDNLTNEISPSVTRGTNFSYGNSNNPTYDGGIMRYVSITHAGKLVIGDTRPASLFLGALGTGTMIDHVQVLESDVTAIGLYGGTVAIEQIYVQNAIKYDLYVTTGYTGTVKDLLAINNPLMQTFLPNTTAVYVENNGIGSAATPLTNLNLDAFTLIGPQQCSSNPSDQSIGIELNNNAGGTFKNGVVSGFETGVVIQDVNTAIRTSSDLILEYISLAENTFVNATSVATWPMTACPGGMSAWIANGCNNESVETSITTLGYDNSICDDFCTDAPIFQLLSSDLQNRELSALKVGVLQEDPVFTWVQTCPAASCCEETSKAMILPLELYPNPAQNLVQIAVPVTQDLSVQLKVIDVANGRILLHTQKSQTDAGSIDVSTYPMGTYKIILQTSEGSYQATLHKTQ